jgi:hypothetical protein
MKKLPFILISGSLSLPTFSRERQADLVSTSMDLVSDEAGHFFTAPLVSNFDKDLFLRTVNYESLLKKRQTSITALTINSAPFFKLGFYGAATVVVTSGFVIPSQNSDGSGFGLYVALASDGNLMALPEVALTVSGTKWDVFSTGLDSTAAMMKINKRSNNKIECNLSDVIENVNGVYSEYNSTFSS